MPQPPAPPNPAASPTVTVPLVEERIELGTRIVETGGVRLVKSVDTREVTVDEPTWHESVDVERRPVGRWVDADAPPQPRQDGDTLIVPVLEEVLVVERRLRLREELHLRRVRRSASNPQRVTLRSERVDVERFVLHAPSPTGPDLPSHHPVPRSFTMAHTLIALFDSRPEAEQARQRLLSEGLSSSDVSLRAASSTETGGTSDTTLSTSDSGGVAGWFKSLFGMSDDDSQVRMHDEALRRGGTMLTVDTRDETQVDRIADILRDCGAIDLEDRSSQWRSEGWDGGTAAAVTSTSAATAMPATGRTSSASDDNRTVPVIEEELAIGTRVVQRGGVRVFTRMVETPVEEQVRLREEHAEVHRRPVNRPATEADLAAAARAGTIEVRETAEEAVVAKRAQVTEEIEVGKRAEERTETVRDTVRHTEVDVDRIGADERDHAMARGTSTTTPVDPDRPKGKSGRRGS